MTDKHKKLNTEYHILNTQFGFTLVETLVAITVLLLAIAAPLSIAAKALFAAYYARDQITAYYLAEEAIEYVKNARDTTFLNDVFNSAVGSSNTNWLLGLDSCISTGVDFPGCIIDATKQFDPYNANDAVVSCTVQGAEVCPPLLYCPSSAGDLDTGLWGYSPLACAGTAETSKFTRKVVITTQRNIAGGTEEALITVTVTWSGAGIVSNEQSYTLTGAMLNWERK